jgi:hypothetical protein
LTEPWFATFVPDITLEVPRFVRCVTRGIGKNRSQLGVVISRAMQEKKARLGCDRDPDLLGDFKPAAAFEMFFGEKDLDVTEELGLILGREAAENWKVACDDRSPCWRKRLGTQSLPSLLLQKPKHRTGIRICFCPPKMKSFSSRMPEA